MAVFSKLVFLAACNLAQADPLWQQFVQFKNKFKIQFETLEEDTKRFSIFKENLERSEELTKKSGGKAKFGVTKFSHLTPEEFKSTRLGYKKSDKSDELKKNMLRKTYSAELSKKAGESIDWRTLGGVSPVKDQGQCGSCWAFSATQAAETGYWKATGNLKILAPQQTTSCDTVDWGCNGGDTPSAYSYMRQAGGIDREKDYPYTSGTTMETGTCKVKPSEFAVKVGDTTMISQGASGESDMMKEIHDSPMSICVDAEPWQFYMGGVVDSSTCGTQLDHCVHLVGYKGGDDNYWIVKNSWNTNWGEDGYIYVRQGENACGVAMEATIVDAGDESTRESLYV